ncbi:hypothetical protein [Paraburkholderia sp. Ac-20340]|nr:hypothetical protein [Paraburkholderia sp. Ac-20340]
MPILRVGGMFDSHVKKIRHPFEAIAPGEDAIQAVSGAGFRLAL